MAGAERMRVLNIMLGRGHGGLEQAAIDYAQLLTLLGFETVTIGHPSGWMRSVLPAEQAFLPLRCVGDYDFFAKWRFHRMVKAMQPTLIIAHGTRAIRFCRNVPNGMKIGVLHNTRFKADLAAMDAFIAVSPKLGAAAAKIYPDKPIAVVPNMVKIGAPMVRPPFRSPPVIGALGRLHHNKGYDVLFEALASPELAGLPWQCVLGGDGPERPLLEAEAKRWGVFDRVRFLGWVSDRQTFFNMIDLFVLPSREEPFGIVLIEAMAAGVPVVATDTDGPSSIIHDGQTGLMVPRDNAQALAGALKNALTSESTMARMGQSGFADVKARFSRDAVAALLTSALDQVLPELDFYSNSAGKPGARKSV